MQVSNVQSPISAISDDAVKIGFGIIRKGKFHDQFFQKKLNFLLSKNHYKIRINPCLFVYQIRQ